MSHYILDASILVQHVILDNHTANVDVLFEQVGISTTVHVPEFCLLECTNVLWKQARFHNVSQAIVLQHAQDLSSLNLTIVSALNLLPNALEIGLKHQLAVYDSVYIVMAKQLGYPLITDDRKQAKIAIAEGITLKSITDFKP